MLSLEKCLLRSSACCKSGLFWCWWVVWILYIFWVLTPYQIYNMQTPSPIQLVAFLFWWWFPLLCWSVFICCSSFFFNFCFCFPCIWSQIHKNITKINTNEVIACFILEVLWYSVLYSSLFELILCCKTMVWIHSFACGCPISPTPFIEKTILSPSYVPCSFIIN